MFITKYFRGTAKDKEDNTDCKIPMTLQFFPYQLFEWDPDNDYNVPFNIVRQPLIKRSNDNPFKIIGLFSMSSVGIPTQGTNDFNIFDFYFWQYIDIFCYFGGSSSTSLILPPSPNWIRTAHKNGVKIYGTVFFPPNYYGGKIEWVNELIYGTPEDPMYGAKQLIRLCNVLGFDGWFINQETGGGNKETGLQIQKFLLYIQETSNIEIMWYDAMIYNGQISYQNELNKYNSPFFEYNNQQISNSIFPNFWWTNKNLIESNNTATKLNRSPYQVFTGINVEQDGFSTDNLIYNIYNNDKPYTSIGLFGCQWTFDNKITVKESYERQVKLWNLISKYKTPYTVYNSLPLITYFNTGKGKQYYINGQVVQSNRNWNDIGQQDYLPTWINTNYTNKDNHINCDIYYDDSYIGGSCYNYYGTINKNQYIDIPLFDTNIELPNDNILFELYCKYKLNYDIKLSLIIKYDNTDTYEIKFNIDPLYDIWFTSSVIFNNKSKKLKLKKANKIITKISLRILNNNIDPYFNLLLGGIKINTIDNSYPNKPKDFRVICSSKVINNIKSLNITWTYDKDIWYYYLNRIIVGNDFINNQFIGRTSSNIYHINKLKKANNEVYSIISLKAVSINGNFSKEDATIKVCWI
jgi:endo-beta-N-acetylglucosaminidase D